MTRHWSDIGISGSSGITVVNNTIVYNGHGIYLYKSSGNMIANNTIINNGIGVYLHESSSNTVVGNVFTNAGLAVYHSYGNTVVNNTVNGKPLVYFEGVVNVVIDYPVGQVIAVRSVNITVKDITIENTDIGTEFIETYNSKIENCVIRNNWYGIYFEGSSGNNTIVNNGQNGNLQQ